MNIKEKLIGALGWVGFILYYAFALFICVFPVAVISSHYDWPTWVYFLVAIAAFKFDTISFIFWIFGLIVTIKGPQDTLAIIYYIAFVIINLSGYFIALVSWIVSLFRKE